MRKHSLNMKKSSFFFLLEHLRRVVGERREHLVKKVRCFSIIPAKNYTLLIQPKEIV